MRLPSTRSSTRISPKGLCCRADSAELDRPCGALRRRRRPAAGRIVGCAELAPLSATVAEVRSLVVDRPARALGVGQRLVEELRSGPASHGFEQLCAFTHDAGYFVRQGFSIVPHALGAGEDRARLPALPAVPAVRTVRGGACRSTGRQCAAVRSRRVADDHDCGDRTVVPIEAASPPAGFRAAGIACGIKAAGKLDLALVAADRPVGAAAIFTTNQAKAAPVLVSRGAPRVRAAASRRSSSPTAAARTRAPAARAWPTRARWRRWPPTSARLRAVAGARRIDRRHRRQSEDGRDPHGIAPLFAASSRTTAMPTPLRRS